MHRETDPIILIVQYKLNVIFHHEMSATRTIAGPRRNPRTATTSPFVERLAVALEMDGFPRIAGRIFGLLIISDTEISLDEIASTLGASKASAKPARAAR